MAADDLLRRMREIEQGNRQAARERTSRPDPAFDRLREAMRRDEAWVRQQREMAKARREAVEASLGADGSWSLPATGQR